MDMNQPTEQKLNVYIPGLPRYSTNDLSLLSTAWQSRLDLAIQCRARGLYIGDITAANPWLKNILERAAKADAFLFSPMTSLHREHRNFQQEAAQRWFEFFSVITGVHIGSREKYNNSRAKPCVVMDPDGQWQMAIDLLHDLHRKGMFSSRVEDILHVVHGNPERPGDYNALNAEAVNTLLGVIEQGQGKEKKEVKKLYSEDTVFSPFRANLHRHPFGVAVFGSATTIEQSYLKQTALLTEMVGQRGWRMITGAGKDGCMGAADEGFDIGKKTFNTAHPDAAFKPAHIGVSTQDILRLEGPPDYLEQLIVSNNIYDRMKIMLSGQRSSDETQRVRDAVKVVFVVPGGIGTLHEFATMMQLAANGSLMDDKKIILFSPPSHLNASQGFWDPLVETAKKLGFDKRFEVASTPEVAIELADKAYFEWLQRYPEHKELPHPKR